MWRNGRRTQEQSSTQCLPGQREFAELGADEYLAGDGVCVIEWAEKVADVLPEDRLTVTIEVTGPTARRIEITGVGDRHERIVRSLESPPARC